MYKNQAQYKLALYREENICKPTVLDTLQFFHNRYIIEYSPSAAVEPGASSYCCEIWVNVERHTLNSSLALSSLSRFLFLIMFK